jgi:hypothetical protein
VRYSSRFSFPLRLLTNPFCLGSRCFGLVVIICDPNLPSAKNDEFEDKTRSNSFLNFGWVKKYEKDYDDNGQGD